MKYGKEIVEQVWENARAMPDKDPTEWRKDECGAWIKHEYYGSVTSEFGWKIERVSPGEVDDLANLRAFHRENSYDSSIGRPNCHVTADRENVHPTSIIDAPRNRRLD